MATENVKSAHRVFKILEVFSREQRALSVAEIAVECNFPQSSTSALMRTVVELGYLSFDRVNRTYRPTLRLPLLVNWVSTSLFKGDEILQLMQELSERTNETILLCAENGRYSRYIHLIEATGSLRLHAVAGDVRPYTQTATGLMLLSTWDNRRLAGFIHRANSEEQDPIRRVDLSALIKQLETIRQDGYAVSLGGYIRGGGAVGMLLPRQNDEPPMSIGIGGPQANVVENSESWIKLMRTLIPKYFTTQEAIT